MCDFFSCLSDGEGNLYYFGGETRKVVRNLEGRDKVDSHTTIAQGFGFKGSSEDKLNKYEYNPITKVLTKDTMSAKDDSERVKRQLDKLDFKKIAPREYQEFLDKIKAQEEEQARRDKIREDRARIIEVGDKCRIRTAKELEAIFGANWENEVEKRFPSTMHHLLGKKFTVRYESYDGNYRSEENIEATDKKVSGYWHISKDMLVKIGC